MNECFQMYSMLLHDSSREGALWCLVALGMVVPVWIGDTSDGGGAVDDQKVISNSIYHQQPLVLHAILQGSTA